MYIHIVTEAGPPQNLKVTHSADDAPDEFTLQWDMPKNPNGVILGYEVTSHYTETCCGVRCYSSDR